MELWLIWQMVVVPLRHLENLLRGVVLVGNDKGLQIINLTTLAE
jgi:hypothetical protein